MQPTIIQDLAGREEKIIQATSLLKSPAARAAFIKLAHEFPDFIVGCHCGAYRKAFAFLADWSVNIVISIEDEGEWERIE